MSSITVCGLNIHPVKSAQALALDTLTLVRNGPRFDRQWMVVDDQGCFITQREIPLLCKVSASVDDGGILHLMAPQMAPISISPASARASLSVRVWDDSVVAEDCGEAAAQWFSDYIGKDCRLVDMPENCRRKVDENFAKDGETVGFADGFPLLLISQGSLDDLNQRLTQPIGMERFRPNIVVSGCAAFAEDQWQSIRIGDIEFTVAKPCSRCVIPSIDPTTGEKQRKVVQVLARYRRREGAVYFGQNLLHRSEGIIALGQSVEVLA